MTLNKNSGNKKGITQITPDHQTVIKPLPYWFITKISGDYRIKLMNYLCSGLLIFPTYFVLPNTTFVMMKINCTYISSYNLGANYCRVNHKYGGVSIFFHETLSFTTIELSEFCNDQDIEICAVKSQFSSSNFCILSVYRPPSGNFIYIF
jgi:hypothetical protein